MADKTLAQVMDLVREVTALPMQVDTFLDQAFLLRLQKIHQVGVRTGDDRPENADMINAINALATSAGSFREACSALIRSTYRTLGRFVGAPDAMQEDQLKHLDYFAEYLRAQNKQIQARGFTKPTTASFSGAGAGKLALATTDLAGQLIDVGHIDTIKLECTRDQSRGAAAGQEEFLITGTQRVWPWQEGGIGTAAGDYAHPYGRVKGDLIPVVARAGGKLTAVPATNGLVNLIAGGDFEGAFSGTDVDKIPEWTITGGTAGNITAETSAPINGSQNPKALANFKIEQLIPDGRLRAGGCYGIGLKVFKFSGGSTTLTGTLTVKIMDRDEGTTHGTLTVDLSTVTHNTRTIVQPIIFKIPNNAEQLKCVVELASLGGDGTDKTVHWDDVCVAEARMIDGILCFLSDGTTTVSGSLQGRFARGDTFTFATTSTDAGKIQKNYANRAAGRYLPSDTAADAGFEDPAEEPAITLYDPDGEQILSQGEGGEDNAGTGLATPFTRTYTIVNSGLYPLVVDNIAFSAETNVAGSVDTPPPQVIREGESATFVVEFTPAGTGAIASTVTIEFNDPAGAPDDLDFVFDVTGTAT